ncbi:MAG: hypothetical protein FWC06_00295 [Treponema sp.]|nr:hypothetical protein [Treponema sp.]
MKNLRSCYLYTFLILYFITAPCFLAAQSTADEIENLLNTKAVTYAQAVRFVLEAANITAVSGYEEAYHYASERSLLPKNISMNQTMRLDGLSLLLMKSFNLKGGLFYSMFKNPHYAYRELVYRDVIQGRADPGMNVTGERFLFYVNRILTQEGF